MKFIYVVLLGLIIFNGTILLFADFFPDNTEVDHAVDVETELSEYGNVGEDMLSTFVGNGLTTSLAIFSGAIVVGLLTKQLGLFIGIGAFASVVGGLWASTSSIIFNINDNSIVSGLITLITIAIGIVFIFSVVDMLTGQRSVN